MSLNDTKDILYLVLAFCVFWFTAFVCWALWYVIRMLRDASNAVHEIREKIAAIDEAVKAVRERVEHSLGSFTVAATGMKILGSYLAKRGEKAAAKAASAVRDIKKKAAKVKRRLEEELEDESEDLS